MQKLSDLIAVPQSYETHNLRLSETGRCPRFRHLSANDVEATDDANLPWGILEFGNKWEDALMERLCERDSGWNRQLEVSLFGVLGHVDGWNEEKKHLLEVKTVSRGARKFLPNKDNLLQLAAYAASEVDGKPLAPTQATLLYCFREDPAQMVEFNWDCESNEFKGFMMNSARITSQALTTLDLTTPDIPDGYTSKKYPCTWRTMHYEYHCPYWTHCWGDSGEEQALEPDAVPDEEAARALTEAWTQYHASKDVSDHQQKVYKDTLSGMTDNLSETSYRLSPELVLVRRHSNRTDLTALRAMGVDVPTKTSYYWSVMRRGEEGAE